METETKAYEIAYILHGNVAEDELMGQAGKVSAIIEDMKGMVSHSETPKKRKLFYPIQKERNAYFGWTKFMLTSDGIAGLDKRIREEMREIFLRYLIVEQEKFVAPVMRTMHKSEGVRVGIGVEGVSSESGAERESLDLEALDKKLEEILGK